jgi:hypothetical protein
MTDDIEVEVVETLVPVDPALIHAAPTDQVLAVQTAYHALCDALLEQSDYQTIGDKQFRKKSGWRKLAVAFNVSTELLSETEIRGHRNRIEEVKCIVRAHAPNGRYQDGVGVCSIYERCCDPASCRLKEFWPDTGKPTGHVHCGETCNGRHHFSNAAHDIPSTAMTRATNRAQADLFGMGEVSAEEIVDNGNWTPGETAGGAPDRPSRQSRRVAGTPEGPKMAVPAQLARIEQLVADLAPLTVDELPISPAALTFGQARHLIDTLEARKAEQDGND